MTTTKTRERIEDLVYKVFNAIDSTGHNTKRYKAFFGGMDDKKFDAWCKKFFYDDKMNFYYEVIPYKVEPTMEGAKKASDILRVPMFERVYMPFLGSYDDGGEKVVYATPTEVAVFYIGVKRLQQMINTKNHTSISIDARNPKTGTVIGHDKNSRNSDTENISLIATDMLATAREMNGPRADDMEMKLEMFKQINQDGYVSMEKLPSRKENKVALNTLNTYYLAAGIVTDLVNDGLVLQRTKAKLGRDVSTVSSQYDKENRNYMN